jgi:uncharacterized membrane protein YeaQ/YmgE (transglycosylase-associated protein family)
MGIIGWIPVGLIAGTIARLILPGDDPGGIIGRLSTGARPVDRWTLRSRFT